MKFGIREICNVVLRAKNAQKIGNRVFYKNEPVIYFDTLKTSLLESQSTTVYAQGGRGNARLIAWEGERTVTFTMEDALISKEGFSILSGAGLIEATEQKPIIVHKTEITNQVHLAKRIINDNSTLSHIEITLKNKPYKTPRTTKGVNNKEDFVYIMLLDDNGNIVSEPFIASERFKSNNTNIIILGLEDSNYYSDSDYRINDLSRFDEGCSVLVDYYTEETLDIVQIDITPDKFSGNFYLEASTLFRNANGVDMPAEFIIPNCKIQSNFNFTMASSGDPSTFTFTLDAFPDYTRWNQNKKVFAAIQVIEQNEVLSNLERLGTPHSYKSPEDYNPYLTYKKEQEQYLTDEPELPVLNDIFYSIDENGNLYNGTGYKKNTGINLTTGADIINNRTGYLTTGFIPCKNGQTIYVSGFKDFLNASSSEGIFLYNNNKQDRTSILGKITNPLALIASDPNIESENFSYTIGSTQLTVFSSTSNNPKVIEADDIRYIRVCFKTTDLSKIAVLVTDIPPAQEAGTRLVLSEPTRNIHTFTEEENNDDDIDELLAYLEEQENNEK